MLRGARWEPGNASAITEGQVHVFSVLDGAADCAPGCAREGDDGFGDAVDSCPCGLRPGRLLALAAWLLDCSPCDLRSVRDGFGRTRLSAGQLNVTVCRDEGGLLIACARGASVALSASTVPPSLDAWAWLPFSAAERARAEAAPAAHRAALLTQWWTRKEAALRLTGRGGLAFAAEVDVLGAGPDGGIVVPETGILGAGGVAYVQDLPTAPDTAASVAASQPVHEAVVWRVRYPVPVGT
ncbi:hypothetical protein ACH4FX_24015 [Streptomyces sp. NPDC018019]|uniref:hypothetical protein n=1 Tax=Streptomyces sp. NPDC018019 TaxID=3365030 RepID=UPI0037ABEDE9